MTIPVTLTYLKRKSEMQADTVLSIPGLSRDKISTMKSVIFAAVLGAAAMAIHGVAGYVAGAAAVPAIGESRSSYRNRQQPRLCYSHCLIPSTANIP